MDSLNKLSQPLSAPSGSPLPAGDARFLRDTISPLEAELAGRLRQQEIIADYALFALRGGDLQELCDEACRNAAEGLSSPFAKLLEYAPDTQDFGVRSAIGWAPPLPPDTRLGSGPRSPSGHAFRTGKPVVCSDAAAAAERDRFRLPRLLREYGIHSAIIVPVRDRPDAEPFGVLEVDSAAADAFGERDVAFMRALANILATALAGLHRTAALGRSEGFAAAVLDACPDCVEVLDASGLVSRINSSGLGLLELDLPASRLGLRWTEQWLPDDRVSAVQAFELAARGGTGRFAAFRPTPRGIPQWWDVLIAPIPSGGFVAVSRNATAQVLANRGKDSALREKDLLMLEVHHRVKNSLQLVQNLLSLQARSSASDSAAAQLGESAARVRTIAAIHDRLYRTGTALEVEVGPYLDGLIEDLQVGLADNAGDRRITLAADAARWPASDVPTLGLVLTELVTNSLKYGAGPVGVAFSQPASGNPSLVVEDEGAGPPPGFDPARSPGLGMRLVTGLLRGQGCGLEIERADGHARFIARLPLPGSRATAA